MIADLSFVLLKNVHVIKNWIVLSFTQNFCPKYSQLLVYISAKNFFPSPEICYYLFICTLNLTLFFFICYITVPWWTSKRLLLSLTCFIGFFFLYSLRVNLSTAIVCMNKVIVENTTTTPAPITYVNTTSSNGTVIVVTVPTTTQNPDEPVCKLVTDSKDLNAEFEWSKELQGLILGAFFWGYTAMQIPSGFLSDRFGPRITVACGMFPVAILTILSPWLARGSPYLLLVGRVIIGVGEASLLTFFFFLIFSSSVSKKKSSYYDC